MALPTIIAVNQTASPILLTRLGLTVPASSSLVLSDFAYRDEIWGDESLYGFVQAGDILLDLGNGTLSQGDSLKFWNLIPFQPITVGVRALRDTNLASLSGTTTADGVSLVAGDRVLLTAQGTASQNGVWVVQAGAWERPDDFGAGQSASKVVVAIGSEGTNYANQMWICSSTAGSDVIGTNNLSFTVSAGGGGSGTLQTAYENGNTITTSAAEGNLTFTTGAGAPIQFVLTGDDFTVNGANDVDFGGGTALASFNLDTSGAITVDSSGAGISLDGAGASNFSTSSGDLTLAATTNSVVITGAEGATDAVQINASNVAGGIDINAGTSGVAVDTTGPISLDSTGTASNLTLTANDAGAATLLIEATNAGAGTGNVDINADDAVTIDGASFSIDGTTASNVSTTGADLTLSTITSGTLAVSSAGALNLSSATTTDIQATGNLTLDSSGGSIGIGTDANTGDINIGTAASARDITIGNSTGATSVTVQAGTGNISLDAALTTITGDLLVQGTTIQADVETVLVEDNHLYLNSNYTTPAAQTGGLVVNYLPIATTDTVATGGFTAGVAAVSNPTVITTGSATFAVGQFIQISGANNIENNGLYEVLSHVGTTLTIRGVGTTATVEDFTQNQFATDSTVAGSITRVNVSVIRTGTDGVWETGSGSSTAVTFTDLLTTGSTTLQLAYEGGNTINATAGQGDIAFTLTSADFTVNGANDVNFGGGTALASFNVDATGGITMDAAGTSNLTVAGANLTLSTTTSGTIAVTAADALNMSSGTTTDIQATGNVTIDSSGGSIGIGTDANTGAIDIGTAASARDISIGNSTGATSITIDSGTGGIDIGTTAVARTTNIATGAAAQTLIMGSTTSTSSATLQTGTGAMTFTAGGIVDVNATGNVTIDSTGGSLNMGSGADTGAINIGTGAAARTLTIGNNTGATAVIINSGTEFVQVDGVTYYGNSAGAPTARSGGFQQGDKYYDTTLDQEMRYDATRAKWLSVEAMTFAFGRNGNVAAGQYYFTNDGKVMSATIGYRMPHNGTIVALGYTRSDSDAATFDVVEGGTSRATVASAATSGGSTTLNGNFTAGGILAVLNQAGGNTTSDVVAWVKVKWRT